MSATNNYFHPKLMCQFCSVFIVRCIKYQKIAHYNFPELKLMFSNYLFCTNNSPKILDLLS